MPIRELREAGWRIRGVRRALEEHLGRRLSLQEFGALVAEREGRQPWPPSTVSRWELGRQRPSDSTLVAIARLGDIPLDQFGLASAVREPPGAAPREEHVQGRLVPWLYRFLAELAEGGATRPQIQAVEHWLIRLVRHWPRIEGQPLEEHRVLEEWSRMADAARDSLRKRRIEVRTAASARRPDEERRFDALGPLPEPAELEELLDIVAGGAPEW